MPIRFKTGMTIAVSGALVLALGIAVAWFVWGRPGRVAGSPQAPSLVVVSPLPGSAARLTPQRQAPPNPPAPRHAPAPDQAPAPNPPPAAPKAPGARGPHADARLAIVIDDLGYNLRVPDRLLALGMPLTFSIIPQQPYSRVVAERIRRAGREFLVHLPMQPLGYPRDDPGPNALMLRMSDAATRRALAAQLDSLPGAWGANNHMGSAYTADAERMQIVQEMLARRGLVFLNSKTSATPVPGEIAHAHRFPYLERDVFLDNVRSERAIRRELEHAIRIARDQGRAIAIGHPYSETYRVLRDRLPDLPSEGVLLVPISDL